MTHLEGPIVESFYDMSLLSWGEKFDTPLPLLKSPSLRTSGGTEAAFEEAIRVKGRFCQVCHSTGTDTPHPAEYMHERASEAQPRHVGKPSQALPSTTTLSPPSADASDLKQGQTPQTDFTLLNAEGFQPFVLHAPHAPIPIALVNRAPHGTPNHADTHVPQDAAWLAGFRLARESIIIQTPDFNNAAVEPILDACRRGVECTLYVDLGVRS
jgi:hypothetical protein